MGKRSAAMMRAIRELGLTCGARTKHNGGKPCRLPPASPTSGNGRCKWHGGLSTGPKTAAGILARDQGRARRWERYRQALQALETVQAQ